MCDFNKPLRNKMNFLMHVVTGLDTLHNMKLQEHHFNAKKKAVKLEKAKYKSVSIKDVVNSHTILDDKNKNLLLKTLLPRQLLFDGSLGIHKNNKVRLTLKNKAKLKYHKPHNIPTKFIQLVK